MNDTNIDRHNPIFGTLQKMKTSQQRTHSTSRIEREPTIGNIQNSYTQLQRETNTTKYTPDLKRVHKNNYCMIF
jgi:hypothetical protein